MLEPRNLLAVGVADSWSWFQSRDVARVSLSQLGEDIDVSNAMGPHDRVASEWIVQLNDSMSARADSLATIGQQLSFGSIDFQTVAGLGSPGLVLLRALSVVRSQADAALADSPLVSYFSANTVIEGSRTTPDDPEFQADRLPGLGTSGGPGVIDAPRAWDTSIGSTQVVVGVVDGGIDATHPDLFLNIWLNQGEIPTTFRDQLVDSDGDGVITFYDLNNLRANEQGVIVIASGASAGNVASLPQLTTATPYANGPNASFVEDRNNNGRIDAIDLLEDVRWADGRDTDNNTFFDDLFGVNFRAGQGDPFPGNRPLDQLGHGTHVAGTIGAVGNNHFGVSGVNWQTQLMSLRILDNDNRSDAAAAIRAINYARQMRSNLTIDDQLRVRSGANVRVLNNSWGQPGGFEQAFETAIRDLNDEGVLFVAASGNGNLLGNGVNNDVTPFYPAGYDSENVIAVAALAASADRLATFSNFGSASVDIAAPGVAVRSTLPGGAFGPANGTSMATPHVSGTAALLWSAMPAATVSEIKEAILSSATPFPDGSQFVSSGGRLNAGAAMNANTFAPSALLVAKQDITTAGGAFSEFTVEYRHQSGMVSSSIGNDDLTVTRQWGPADSFQATLQSLSIPAGENPQNASVVTATYRVAAPGGTWDPLDFGGYQIETVAGSVLAADASPIERRQIGSFRVRIEAPDVLYVNTTVDAVSDGSLRDAIRLANAAAPSPRTIILDSGLYTIDIEPVVDPSFTFSTLAPEAFCAPLLQSTGWSDETTGDFDVTGSVSIVGNLSDRTVIDAQQLDRVFRVHPGASLSLSRVTVSRGLSPIDQGGGGILSLGNLSVTDSVIRDNVALAPFGLEAIRGGGIAAWSGTANISRTWINQNESNFGGGVFYCDQTAGQIERSTISNNIGGGIHSHSDRDLMVTTSTFSGNEGGQGAIFNGKRDGDFSAIDRTPKISGNGRFLAFTGSTNSLPGNSSGDFLVFDRVTKSIEPLDARIRGASEASFSDDGRFVAFASFQVFDSQNSFTPQGIYVLDRSTGDLELVSSNSSGDSANRPSFSPDISPDGRYVVFSTEASNLVSGQPRGIYFVDRTLDTIERIPSPGVLGADSRPSVSADGRFVVFLANTDFAGGQFPAGYVYDRELDTVTQVGEAARDIAISDNGRYIVVEETFDTAPVQLYDQLTQTIEPISLSINGDVRIGFDPQISADGRYIVYHSFESDIVPAGAQGGSQVFLFDQLFRTTERISEDLAGNAGTQESVSPYISADGRFVSYRSDASNLVAGDTNDKFDLFIHDRATNTTEIVVADPTLSTIDVSQSTVAFTNSAEAAIAGAISITDTLIAKSGTFRDLSDVVQTSPTVLRSTQPDTGRIGPLTPFNGLPPVHPLLRNHPAIDAGDPNLAGTVDQRGVVRIIPDIGSFEAIAGSISGKVFVDLNQNQVQDEGE